MAQVSDMKFCVKWKTERPYVGRSRQSSCFRMFGKEWYLQLSFKDTFLYSQPQYRISVRFHRRNGQKALERAVSAICHVIAGSLAFGGSSHTVLKTGDLVLNSDLARDKLPTSEHTQSWVIYCHLSSSTPLSLQINDETINMSVHDQNRAIESVDECIQVSQEVPREIEALSADISGMFEEGILPDFKLQCQDQVFKVHRFVLVARSEVFRAMLSSGMQESETGSANIEDIEAPVLQVLLKFLYSGKLGDLSEDTAFKVYEASDKYAVRSLLAACSYRMIKYLTVDNCIKYLSTADSHSDPDLKAAAVSFIIAHPGVFSSAAWLTFLKEHPVSASEVLQAYVASLSQQFGDLSLKRFQKSD